MRFADGLVTRLSVLLFPEQDVPEQEPARIHKQSQQRVDQRAVEGVVQDALRDDGQEEHAALGQRHRRLLEVLVEEDAVEDRAARTEQHHRQGTQRPERREKSRDCWQRCPTIRTQR